MRARNLKKQLCMYMKIIILKTPLLIYFNFFPKVFSQNLSCQTRVAAYLRVHLIRRCLRYPKMAFLLVKLKVALTTTVQHLSKPHIVLLHIFPPLQDHSQLQCTSTPSRFCNKWTITFWKTSGADAIPNGKQSHV